MASILSCCLDRERLSDAVEALAVKCPDATCCCACCSAFRPRYKRLVDNIFPAIPDDGLVKSNMDKLMWYAMNSPDKLDRIGEYLAYRLFRDINRRKTGYVIISMDALDQLLVSCHANNLNLFVESFLQMVQKLLESTEPALQLRAIQSFEKFANIREDTPSYHRRYDFLVSKFSSMCYSNEDDDATRKLLRIAGIKGLQGVVRKTDLDNLGENIWLPTHMEKIVPSLLYNMQHCDLYTQKPPLDEPPQPPQHHHHQEGEKEPHELAEMCLRELVSRATYGKIDNVVKPLLTHLDHEGLWVKNTFAVQVFKILMYSIQANYSINIIELIMLHINEKSKEPAKIRTGIADVLSKVIPIAAGECIGPSFITIINSLLEHIRSSVVGGASGSEGSVERVYQETLIHALGEYANHLPDYQKVDSMVFILNKVPGSDRVDDGGSQRPEAEVKLQHILLKSLLKVGTKYTTEQYSKTFAQSFLVRLMRLSVSSDAEVRLTLQHILHTLLDRHDNARKLARPTLEIGKLGLTFAKPVRQDVNFWRKSGSELLLCVQENCEFVNNTLANMEAIFCTLMLLLAEIRSDDVMVDILRVLFHIQGTAQNGGVKGAAAIHLHALVSSVMMAVALLVPSLKDHVATVIKNRSDNAPHLLPALLPEYDPTLPFASLPDHLLFDNNAVLELLSGTSLDEKRLTASMSSMKRRHSGGHNTSNSAMDINAINVEVDSASSSPGLPRKSLEEEITFESLKKVLTESPEQKRRAEEERQRRQITEAFMTESFEALVAKIQARQPDNLHNKLAEIFNRLPPPPPASTSSGVATTTTTASGGVGGIRGGVGLGGVPAVSTCESAAAALTSASTYEVPYPDIFIY
ncbi:protein EFR3 homolog cmp44E-like isoform X2 [Eriocheir sinensis]|uniref:protein EFR3 homolog cmp44E-like isoform X2 n=1 Tax=Eriocheir sinensis TaxID=95602 RepID=UPI0021C72FC8|nr:protein EFR3 homolog cmp44E-like isoform X2 [Eriocheir sinensis]